MVKYCLRMWCLREEEFARKSSEKCSRTRFTKSEADRQVKVNIITMPPSHHHSYPPTPTPTHSHCLPCSLLQVTARSHGDCAITAARESMRLHLASLGMVASTERDGHSLASFPAINLCSEQLLNVTDLGFGLLNKVRSVVVTT